MNSFEIILADDICALYLAYLTDQELCVMSRTCKTYNKIKSKRFILRSHTLRATTKASLCFKPDKWSVHKLFLRSLNGAPYSYNIDRFCFPCLVYLNIKYPAWLSQLSHCDKYIRTTRLHVVDSTSNSCHSNTKTTMYMSIARTVNLSYTKLLILENCSIMGFYVLTNYINLIPRCSMRNSVVNWTMFFKFEHIKLTDVHIIPGMETTVAPNNFPVFRTLICRDCTGLNSLIEMRNIINFFSLAPSFDKAVLAGKYIALAGASIVRLCMDVSVNISLSFVDHKIIVARKIPDHEKLLCEQITTCMRLSNPDSETAQTLEST